MTWLDESLHPDYRQRLRISRILHRRKTGRQDLMIFENGRFGRVLCLDDIVQTTEGDEFAYHEMLVHVPLFAHGQARDVLIVGGGDGGSLRQVLRHPVASATMVEIDRTVVDLCRQHLPGIAAGAFDDPRARLVIADGARFVRETADRFDVVIVDSTDPVGPGEILFGEEFYRGCRRCLRPGGILVTQNGVPFFQADELRDSHRRRSRVFADSTVFLTVVPTYAGGFMALGWASDEPGHRAVDEAVLAERSGALDLAMRYYNPEIHRAAFALPGFIAALLRPAA